MFDQKESLKEGQRDPKNEEFGGHFAAPSLDPPKGAKLSQNGTPGDAGVRVFGGQTDAKRTPKWRQSGVKIGSNRGANSRENPRTSTEHR